MLYYTNLMLVLVCPYFIQSPKQQLSQSGGEIILCHKLALTAKRLTDHQVYYKILHWMQTKTMLQAEFN